MNMKIFSNPKLERLVALNPELCYIFILCRGSLTSVGHMCPLAHGVHSSSECLDAGLQSFFRLS